MSDIKIPFRKTGRGIAFKVKVEPRSSKTMIAGVITGDRGDALKVKLASPPVGGKANEELVELLSEVLGVRKSDIRIIHGQGSKQKTVEVAGVEDLKIGNR